MTDTNGLRLTWVGEVTPGTTPNTPRMRTARVTQDALRWEPAYANSDEIRSDRMRPDPIKTDEDSDGSIGIEMHFPVDNSPLSDWYRSLFFSSWVKAPQWDNDGTADSAITQITSATGVVTLTDQSGSSGFAATSIKAGHLVRFTGLTAAGNNVIGKATSSNATTATFGASVFSADDATPAAAARAKVVGFQGASGDITASASGLGSTSLNLTTLGLAVGQWIKIGGTAAGDKFATAACNDWVRITAIAATALTCDNLPTGWTTDSGTGKTIKVWFGDYIRNGTTQYSGTIERGWMRQTTPNYIIQPGMTVNTHDLQIDAAAKVTGSFSFMGMTGVTMTTTSVDSSPDSAPDTNTYPIMGASTNVGRIAEAGSVIAAKNWVQSVRINFANMLRKRGAVGSVGAVDIGSGTFDVTAQINTYFGDNTLITKLKNGTASSLNVHLRKNSQALVLTLPRLTYTGGFPADPGINQDVYLNLRAMASYDSTTGCHAQMDRLEYYE